MPINYPPKKGQLLLCDFSQGFKEPEMVKNSRPVIVISTRGQLVTVAACSTVEPNPIEQYHYKLPKQSMPKIDKFIGKDTWVKGDMIYTIGFHRLELICLGRENGKRIYFKNLLGSEQMDEIRRCVLHGIGMGFLSIHINSKQK